MCYYKHNREIAKIAEKDIVVYKTGKCVKSFFHEDQFSPSVYKEFKYTKDEKTERIEFVNPFDKLGYIYYPTIEKGYHFYLDKKYAISYTRDVGIFIIPKGTIYFSNYCSGMHMGVAEQLIFKDIVNFKTH